ARLDRRPPPHYPGHRSCPPRGSAMTRTVPSLLTLVLVAAGVSAAPAPDAKEKLAALKKKLPNVAQEWWERNAGSFGGVSTMPQPEVRLARQISPTEAKVTVLLTSVSQEPLTIYLHYYDCNWTSTRYEGKWKEANTQHEDAISAIRRLMLAIDELGDK